MKIMKLVYLLLMTVLLQVTAAVGPALAAPTAGATFAVG
jgi:hypothetical protein